MADFMELSDEALDSVAGGALRYVNTHTDANAVIRSDASLGAGRVCSLRNGTTVNITGEVVENSEDGRTWYKIDYPMNGWIPGNLIGM